MVEAVKQLSLQLEKTCKSCGLLLAEDNFYRHKRGTLYAVCKSCHYERTRANLDLNRDHVRARERLRYRKNREKHLAKHRRRKYGMSQEDYLALLDSQNHLCPICLKPLRPSEFGERVDWEMASVDHCHETGRVRGILHRRCNLMLEFKFTTDDLGRAKHYLESGGVAFSAPKE